MISRIVSLLLALPLMALGAYGLGTQLAPGHALVKALAGLLARTPWGLAPLQVLVGVTPRGIAMGAGLLLLAVAFRPRGEKLSSDEKEPGVARVDKRIVKKARRQAASMARKGAVEEAAELCFASGLLDPAATYFEQAEDFVRAAEIRHDQNRFAEAAALYLRAGQQETAGTIFASQNDWGRAAECYHKAGRMSVAAEMYEKAESWAEAAECYRSCEFHRHAARAFVRAGSWSRAAEALDEVVAEETRRSAGGHDAAKAAELGRLVLQAARLHEQADDLQGAQAVLERGECWAPAAELAMRREDFEQAADLYRRAGEFPKAAAALSRIGQEHAAAQLLGEFHRDKGEYDEAARLLAQAGDFMGAGDLYRQLEDYKLAGECYERHGDAMQAALMFKLAGDVARAAGCYERGECFEEAAECAAHMGDAVREALWLEQGGLFLRAGEAHLRLDQPDEAIRVLQQVKAEAPGFAQACALLGELFRSKGQHSLAVKKLRQAIGQRELDGESIQLFYSLATLHEAAGQPREAVDLYEKILTADYHFKDVEERLETTRALVQSLPAPSASASGAAGTLNTPQSRPGRYKVVGELGRGGMGIVYKAQDSVLDRTVAFKVLPDALRDNPQALKNFLREAKSAAKLNHPNIVTVFDAGEQDGRYYIAMEYVDGTTLKEIVRRRGVISPTGVLHVMLQMCEALAYAHSQKVVHRDVKTANTMWTRDRKAKIMDFGLAKVVEEVRNHTTLVSGTPYYMSPEQTLGKNVDHRTDLYSLGVTLFEMATGELPFKEGNVPYHHVHTPPPDPREVNPRLPPALAAILSRCLEKDPANRYQSAGEILEEVRGLMARQRPHP